MQALEPLPSWMRTALFATGVMNVAVACVFVPGAATMRETMGFPREAPAVYLLTVGLFVMLYGLAYLYVAARGLEERLFIAVAAVGKLGFVSLLVGLWAHGSLPLRAPVLGSADVLFSAVFFYWLATSRSTA